MFDRIINPLTTNAPPHIETSQLICIANQLTDFYTIRNIRLNKPLINDFNDSCIHEKIVQMKSFLTNGKNQ